MSFRASVFSKKELALILSASLIVSSILYISYVTGR
ncbi:hypothetical protein NADRNF5_0738 [Nitrosopumilus adriaticus]|uniref:Uncharacterized protein n=1 Tax=Nitrosopumilus adriaticus TaxID=1580092 RepID=A0A0D5C213_9ARCH|nr:hypothetical protein NADRNF5_0738 [Nitrosopumilus adriaticus]